MIITIAREVGSGGNEIAQRVAQLLEAPLIDQDAVTRAAGLAGVNDAVLADPTRMQAAVDQMAGQLLQYPRPSELEQHNRGVPNVPPFDSAPFRRFIDALLRRIGKSGKTVVILGYAAQVSLRDHPNAFHVFVCAPASIRASYLRRGDEFSRENASRVIRESDQVRAEVFKQYLNVDWRSPELYHLMVNTGDLSYDRAARLIAQASTRVLTPA